MKRSEMRGWSPLRWLLLSLLASSLLVGCGLPVTDGVRVPGPVAAEQRSPGGAAFLPPGPQPGASPPGVVNGFLFAQKSPAEDHAIARQFLAPEIRDDWDDDAGVQVYDPQSLVVETIGGVDGPTATVRVTGVLTGTIGRDGSRNRVDEPLDETYQLRREPDGSWRLLDVPAGLRLEPEDVVQSYTPSQVYYLARGGQGDHLVADPALLPLADDPAGGLVHRLMQGPSATLVGAVDSAVPVDAEVLGVTTDAAGLVSVDLGPQVATLPPAQLQRLSAQLVWTLRGAGSIFTGLRLLSAGRPVPVDVPGQGEREIQDRDAWEDYDPNGLSEQVTTYYLADRQLRTVEGSGLYSASGGPPVDLAAVSPRTDLVALLTDVGEGRWEVRTGPLGEPPPAQPDVTGVDLSSPSWGSGTRGLWLLRTGVDPQILLMNRLGEVREIPVADPPPGQITALRVSRDGARIALIAGEDEASRRVYVATVLQEGPNVQIGPPREVGFGVSNVSDVVWETGTSLVALGQVSNPQTRLPLRLAVDGSSAVDFVGLQGLEQLMPQSVAAGPERPLVVAAMTREGQPLILRSQGGVFAEQPITGSQPFYPG